jgi:hypothetical protein
MTESPSNQNIRLVLEQLRRTKGIEVGLLIGDENTADFRRLPKTLWDYNYVVLVGQKKARILARSEKGNGALDSSDSSTQQKIRYALRQALSKLNADLKQTSIELSLERFATQLEAVFR